MTALRPQLNHASLPAAAAAAALSVAAALLLLLYQHHIQTVTSVTLLLTCSRTCTHNVPTHSATAAAALDEPSAYESCTQVRCPCGSRDSRYCCQSSCMDMATVAGARMGGLGTTHTHPRTPTQLRCCHMGICSFPFPARCCKMHSITHNDSNICTHCQQQQQPGYVDHTTPPACHSSSVTVPPASAALDGYCTVSYYC